MRKYELTIILDTSEKTNQEAFVKKLEVLFKKEDIKIEKKEDFGVKDFAYGINKKKKGAFLFYNLETEKKELNNMLLEQQRLSPEIIRFLLIKI